MNREEVGPKPGVSIYKTDQGGVLSLNHAPCFEINGVIVAAIVMKPKEMRSVARALFQIANELENK